VWYVLSTACPYGCADSRSDLLLGVREGLLLVCQDRLGGRARRRSLIPMLWI
jgi:hypothetical protein